MTKKFAIGYVHPGMVTHEFHESMMAVRHSYPDIPIIHIRSGPLISRARNRIAGAMLNMPDVENLLFVDTDMAFSTLDVDRLLKRQDDIGPAIISGACPVKHEDGHITIGGLEHSTETPWLFDTIDRWDPGTGVLEVFSTGMAFTMIHRDVIVKLMNREPIPLWPFAEGTFGEQPVGEDTLFCIRAREAGFKSWIDTNTIIGHVKSVVL
jgi:GT2 family glycosyltransferase